jgi:hypothetical protein
MRSSATSRRRESQGGYALLMIFLMAAIIALMLYQQLPRVAFESEREKEQLLIDRGQQYTRAIQLYYLANNRTYPTSLDDLEKQERRFLRQRFVDPFTGKAEWRIIHTNGALLTDSLVQKPPATGDAQSQSASTVASNSTNGTNPADQVPQVNAAVLQRPSDRPATSPLGFSPPIANQDPNNNQDSSTQTGAQAIVQPGNPLPPITILPQSGQGQGQGLPPITLGTGNQPGGLPPITLTPMGGPAGQQMPGQIPAQIPNQNTTQTPGQPRNGQIPPFPGQPGIQTGVPPGFQIDSNGQLVPNTTATAQMLNQQALNQTSGSQTPGNQIAGQPFSPPPANQANPGPAGATPNGALNVINQLLTNPRQTATTTTTPTGSNQIGAIAGVASTHKGPSIKVYKDQTQYQLWEFVFSTTANTTPGAATPPATPGQTPATPNGNQASPFGNSFSNGTGTTR